MIERRRQPLRARLALAAAAAIAFAGAAAWSSGPALAARAPGDELPDGPGKKVLVRACTTCHDLDEVTKFKGYYTRAQWKDIVVTMKEYGARSTTQKSTRSRSICGAAIGKKE